MKDDFVYGHVRYELGNPLKVKFKKHFCYNCGEKLQVTEYKRVIARKDPDAKYFSFHGIIKRAMFIHDVFHCPNCSKIIEPITQLDYENIDIIIQKVIRNFKKKGLELIIQKIVEDENGCEIKDVYDLSENCHVRLVIQEEGKADIDFVIPIKRFPVNDRPFEILLSKRKLIKFIKERKFVH